MAFGTFIDSQKPRANDDWTGEKQSVASLKSEGWEINVYPSKQKNDDGTDKSPFYVATNGAVSGIGPASSKIDWATATPESLFMAENTDGLYILVGSGSPALFSA